MLQMRIMLDHSCVEIFMASGEVLSTRIYRGSIPPDEVLPLAYASSIGLHPQTWLLCLGLHMICMPSRARSTTLARQFQECLHGGMSRQSCRCCCHDNAGKRKIA